MSRLSHVWLAAVAALLAAFVVAALLVSQSYRLTVFCDITEALLLASGAASFLRLAVRSHGRMRLFWSLLVLGIALWLSYQLMWTYYEVLLRRDVPEIFAGDVVLFLNLVPLMGALALRPHIPRDEYAARLGRLDFALLLVWWVYLYVLIVIPWQYVVSNVAAYEHNLNAVYLVEKIVLLAGLAASWAGSKGPWRNLYASLFGMSFCYSTSSAMANWAIAGKAYYSGSLYDIPLAMAMAWITWIGLRSRAEEPQPDAREVSTVYGVWVARCGMIAVFSLPLFAAWAMSEAAIPARIRVFRLSLTLMAAFVMGVMVFLRQHRLDRELVHLLSYSQESYDQLKRLQTQILQSEKLASIGQLVAGAAHELNNPITAMLGYSDLLSSTRLTAEQKPLATKIGQHVRRTKALVASLISFARQAPAPKAPIDLNTLARTAIKLTQPQWEPQRIQVHTQFDAALPKVLGDSNQLLQMCLQLIENCLHSMRERGGNVLAVSSQRQAGSAVLQITAGLAASASSSHSRAATTANAEDSFGLAACQGIMQAHHGQISCRRREDGAIVLRVELTAIEAQPENGKETTVPVLWQSQPSS